MKKSNIKPKVFPGQILLITLLVLSIATTIALSLVARSTVDLNISTQIEESSRAFSAAEAGIEAALKNMSAPVSTTLSSGARYDVDQVNIGGGVGPVVFDSITKNGSSETIWLVNHTSAGLPDLSASGYTNSNMTVCWSSGAVVVTVYYRTGSGDYRVVKAAYDSSVSRSGAQGESNRFTTSGVSSGSCGGVSGGFYRRTINFSTDLGVNPSTNRLIMMQIRPVYSDANIAVNPGGSLPLQGFVFTSCGSTGAGTTRCINVHERYRAVPGIFDHALYSNQGSILKN